MAYHRILHHDGRAVVDRVRRWEARSRVVCSSLHTREVMDVEVPSARLQSGYKNGPSFGYALLARRPLPPSESRNRDNDGSDCANRPPDRSLEGVSRSEAVQEVTAGRSEWEERG